jgi:transcriptional regulator with XRE-family HTH domain
MGADAAGFFSQLGLALIILREKAGLAARGLAARAGVGKSQLSKYENGRESPKLETLARLLDALNVEPLASTRRLKRSGRGIGATTSPIFAGISSVTRG